ncbi:unnamed protein product, partial [Echinostoma caproni]|uniref:Coatomer subunit delta n=1 Tax=Echinostoma caproni TaxID=27848 RepID=A0A183B590_9TREM
QTNWLQVKPGGKPFPVGQEVGVLRWRLQTQDESVLPITVNCWPNEIRGGFEVNIEYELQNTDIELHDVVVNIPLPSSSKPPVVGNCDGEYELVARKTQLEWRLPVIDTDNPSGSIEFTISADRGSKADDFFPLKLSLSADKSFCGIRVLEAVDPKNKPVTFSTETRLYAEKYEISKEREAKDFMKQRARDLQLARQEAAKRGAGSGGGSSRSYRGGVSGFGSDTPKPDEPRVVVVNDRFGEGGLDGASYISTAANAMPSVKRSGMKLGGGGAGAGGGIDQFVDQLKAEGEAVHDDVARLLDPNTDGISQSGDYARRAVGSLEPRTVLKEDLHIRIEEKLMVQASRDGGLEQLEVQGIMHALANTAATNEARLRIDTNEALNPHNEKQPPAQLQTHPNLDKKAFVVSLIAPLLRSPLDYKNKRPVLHRISSEINQKIGEV